MPAAMATNIASAFANGLNVERMGAVQAMMGASGAEMVDIAALSKTAVFLCSDNASVLNGAEIVADHGLCSI